MPYRVSKLPARQSAVIGAEGVIGRAVNVGPNESDPQSPTLRSWNQADSNAESWSLPRSTPKAYQHWLRRIPRNFLPETCGIIQLLRY